MSRARHMTKMDDPRKVHSQLAFPINAKCNGCGRRPMIRGITLCPMDEARKRMPELEALMVADPDGFMKNVVEIRENPKDVTGKPYLRLGIAYACETCKRELEKTLAKSPSWMIVEINYGPKARAIFST